MRFLYPLAIILLLLGCNDSSNSQPADREISLEEKIGQMLMVGFRGMEVSEESPIVDDIQNLNLGGVILFDYDVPLQTPERNITSPGQVKQLITDLQQYASTPLFIAVDQEGGQVVRLKPRFGFPETVSAQYLGNIDNTDSTRYYAGLQAALLNTLGINLNFAPVVDLNTNPENPIIGRLERSFSPDPDIVTRHARIIIHEYLSHNVVPVLKHFPGHGSAWNDSHKGIADVTDTWEPVELEPYQHLISRDSVPAVMTAHVFNAELDSIYPATLSRNILTGVLREQLSFDGLIFSDDMQMNAVREEFGLDTALRQAIAAGIDILVFANNSVFEPNIAERAVSIIKGLVDEGEISRERIEESYERIMKAKSNF